MKNNIAEQRKAGTLGRKRGHSYEAKISEAINAFPTPFSITDETKGYLKHGNPQEILVNKLLQHLGWKKCTFIKAYCTGGLATAESGDKTLIIEGKSINSSKSDIIVVIKNEDSTRTIGVSIKQCNNIHPTNDQLFFTTATAFHELIVRNGFNLSNNALIAMKQFCGDLGYRPIDSNDCIGRISSPERYFWEEIDKKGQKEWETLFRNHQDEVTRLLLQKGYAQDPFPPEIILHKTKKTDSSDEEIAIFSTNEFISLSKKYGEFQLVEYRVTKGRFKEPQGVVHLAPRFGVVQMQRGGQKQHPTQLQFNLKSGYFYHSPFSI